MQILVLLLAFQLISPARLEGFWPFEQGLWVRGTCSVIVQRPDGVMLSKEERVQAGLCDPAELKAKGLRVWRVVKRPAPSCAAIGCPEITDLFFRIPKEQSGLARQLGLQPSKGPFVDEAR